MRENESKLLYDILVRYGGRGPYKSGKLGLLLSDVSD